MKIPSFINFLKKHRKKMYLNMNFGTLIDRILLKRAVTFINNNLLNGQQGINGWEYIGTKYEKYPLTLDNCLSYEEIKLSALLSISSYSYFINQGGKYNNGIYQRDRNAVENIGIIIGLIGPRLEKKELWNIMI